jgi:hypothetical protein
MFGKIIAVKKSKVLPLKTPGTIFKRKNPKKPLIIL